MVYWGSYNVRHSFCPVKLETTAWPLACLKLVSVTFSRPKNWLLGFFIGRITLHIYFRVLFFRVPSGLQHLNMMLDLRVRVRRACPSKRFGYLDPGSTKRQHSCGSPLLLVGAGSQAALQGDNPDGSGPCPWELLFSQTVAAWSLPDPTTLQLLRGLCSSRPRPQPVGDFPP